MKTVNVEDTPDSLEDCEDDTFNRLDDCEDDTSNRLDDCEDDTSNRMDDCDDIKIEMEENTVSVDPAEILKQDTKEEQGLVEEKSGNQDPS